MIRVRIPELLDAHRSSANQLADVIGVAGTTIYRLINGEVQGIQFETLDAICRHFDVGVGAVLEYMPDDEASAADDLLNMLRGTAAYFRTDVQGKWPTTLGPLVRWLLRERRRQGAPELSDWDLEELARELQLDLSTLRPAPYRRAAERPPRNPRRRSRSS